MRIYPLVRINRALASSLIVHQLSHSLDYTVHSVALSETASFVFDIIKFIPYFGNIFWLLMLFPKLFEMYNDVYFVSNEQKLVKEFTLIGLVIVTIIFCNI